jgi:hypothetical protein
MARRLLTAGAVVLSFALGSATAQDTANTDPGPTARSDGAVAAREDSGFDRGWLGMIGLAGLAGLLHRDRRDRPSTPAHSTTR